MSGLGRRVAAATVTWLLCAMLGTVSPQSASRPEWLHLTATPPERSRISGSVLELDTSRAHDYADQGRGTAELLRRHELSLDRDGRLVTRVTFVRKYLTEEGVRQWGLGSVSVRSQIQELYLDEAWIQLPDGKRRNADLGQLQIVSAGSSDVFSDVVDVVIPFDGLIPGSTSVVVARIVERPGEWPLPWSKIFLPQGWSPIERLEVTLDWDPSLPRLAMATDAEFLECEEAESRITCSAESIPIVDGADENTIWLDLLPHLVLGQPHSWSDLAQAELQLISRSVGRDAGIDQAAARLTEDATGERDRLERIHRFVADEIRYLALEHGESAVAPTAIEETLDRRYGDCKGKVALFLALCERAGIRAYPVLVSTSRNSVDKLLMPSWRFFEHMIACAEIEGERAPVCVDLTSPVAATGILPAALYGSVALDLKDGVSEPRIIEIPAPTWNIEIEADNAIDCEGNLVETLERRFLGVGAAERRSLLRSLTNDQRIQWAVEHYQSIQGADSEPEFEFEGIEDPTQSIVVRSTTSFEQVLSSQSTDYREYDAWLTDYAGWFATSNEIHPVFVAGARIRSRMRFRLCPGDAARFVGASLDMESEFGFLKRSYTSRPQGVEVETVFEIYPQTIGADKLARFKRFMKGAMGQVLVWFSLERKGARGAS